MSRVSRSNLNGRQVRFKPSLDRPLAWVQIFITASRASFKWSALTDLRGHFVLQWRYNCSGASGRALRSRQNALQFFNICTSRRAVCSACVLCCIYVLYIRKTFLRNKGQIYYSPIVHLFEEHHLIIMNSLREKQNCRYSRPFGPSTNRIILSHPHNLYIIQIWSLRSSFMRAECQVFPLGHCIIRFDVCLRYLSCWKTSLRSWLKKVLYFY